MRACVPNNNLSAQADVAEKSLLKHTDLKTKMYSVHCSTSTWTRQTEKRGIIANFKSISVLCISVLEIAADFDELVRKWKLLVSCAMGTQQLHVAENECCFNDLFANVLCVWIHVLTVYTSIYIYIWARGQCHLVCSARTIIDV